MNDRRGKASIEKEDTQMLCFYTISASQMRLHLTL
jgi:hypothetical protein